MFTKATVFILGAGVSAPFAFPVRPAGSGHGSGDAPYFQASDNGKNLDRCLAVSPTWEENRLLTQEIRAGLKERELIPKEDTACTVHESFKWTEQQRGHWRNYR